MIFTALPRALGEPGGVAAGVERLDGLELVVAVRIAVVGGAQAVGDDRHPAGLEHLHRHRRARSRQARDDDDRLAAIEGDER